MSVTIPGRWTLRTSSDGSCLPVPVLRRDDVVFLLAVSETTVDSCGGVPAAVSDGDGTSRVEDVVNAGEESWALRSPDLRIGALGLVCTYVQIVVRKYGLE